jgi:hypothetical protein
VQLIPTIGDAEMVKANLDQTGTKLINLSDDTPGSVSPSPVVLGEAVENKPQTNWLPFIVIAIGAGGLITSLILLFRHARRVDILN